MRIKRSKHEVTFADRDGNYFFAVAPVNDNEFIVGGYISTALTYREMVKLCDELERILSTGRALK